MNLGGFPLGLKSVCCETWFNPLTHQMPLMLFSADLCSLWTEEQPLAACLRHGGRRAAFLMSGPPHPGQP